MMAVLNFLLAVSLVALDFATAYPNPPAISGNITWVHDPTVVLRDDGTYYRFVTDGGIAISTAPALTGPWDYQGAVLPDGSVIQLYDDQHIWAPDCHGFQGTYYCFYSVSRVGDQNSRIGLATSTSMDPGTWTDHGEVGLPESSDWNRIDPNLFIPSADSSGPFYFTFGSAWHDIYQTELTLASNFTAMADGVTPWNVVYNGTNRLGADAPPVVEGSFQFQWPNADGVMLYYLFFSSGACCQAEDDLLPAGEEYKVMVCRSDVPNGPFVDEAGRNCLTEDGGTLVLASHDNVYAPGGQSVMVDDDRPVLLYHYVNKEIGFDGTEFQFGFNYMDFSSGWPVVVE